MITITEYTYEAIKFPAGELHVTVTPNDDNEVFYKPDILFEFENCDEIMILSLLVDALKRMGASAITLIMPYVPFGRQDRVANYGESLSLKVFCDMINTMNFYSVKIIDPHSSVTTALLDRCKVITQSDVFSDIILSFGKCTLISPDGGSLKKIYELAKQVDCENIVECSKLRDTKTGNITDTVVHSDNLIGKVCIIVDDICDGGRTFIEIAKVLKKKKAKKIILCVTHGLFTKGLKVFDGLIDEIYTRKGKVK